MPYCPINLSPVPDGETYSRIGLRSIHPKLTHLLPLDLSQEEQLRQARLRADKMSVQGVQPKLSAVLKVKDGRFEIVDQGGRYLLKPNPPPFEEVPANEAVTMSMAAAVGIEVPPHGLLRAVDGSWIYLIQRFDRTGRSAKQHVEDFAQLTGATRETKYDSSLERVVAVVERYCTFPALEKPRLARRLLFCFLTGNEDMHLKNFSLTKTAGTVRLSPAYDLLNTTLVLEDAVEESALPLNGKKRKLTRALWLDYLCHERLGLPPAIIFDMLKEFGAAVPRWREMLSRCGLSAARQTAYLELLVERLERLGISPT
jgi:serine/threonine-protein kinase HipA